ncbi:hypothetical protein Q5752_007001 [Cryptotrichosporon argae]
MSAQTVFRTGAVLTATGISLGAFGAHALRSRFPSLPERSLANWGTASSYLVYNGLALLALSAHPRLAPSASSALVPRSFRVAAALITAGAVVFSGSIVGLVLARERVGKVFGPLTPIGGTAMIAGYAILALA